MEITALNIPQVVSVVSKKKKKKKKSIYQLVIAATLLGTELISEYFRNFITVLQAHMFYQFMNEELRFKGMK